MSLDNTGITKSGERVSLHLWPEEKKFLKYLSYKFEASVSTVIRGLILLQMEKAEGWERDAETIEGMQYHID